MPTLYAIRPRLSSQTQTVFLYLLLQKGTGYSGSFFDILALNRREAKKGFGDDVPERVLGQQP